ncbi:MAG: family 16 glycoside hydrolase [Terriglobia bacterium]
MECGVPSAGLCRARSRESPRSGAAHWVSIRARGEILALWVNGAKQSEFTPCNNSEGYIGLEAEGSEIEFRNLRVKTLPD